ncbi:MAG TPA: fused MFS/spermidine synthase [Candidatus Binatia bacterium]|jgi:spermidine synthase
MTRLLWLCFCLSGAAALALEMLWMRSAGLVLGATAITAATVLACYFTGLGLGSSYARRKSTRPVFRYGCWELGAAAGAFFSLVVFSALAWEPAQVWLSTAPPAGRVAAVLLAILPTTFCLGATLPTLAQALASIDTIGRRASLLYAVNTVGGVIGAAAAGFGLPIWMGVRASYLVAAGASLMAGLSAILIGDRNKPLPATRSVGTGKISVSRARLRLIAAGTGALALGLEVLWTHLFAQVLHNSVYSFTAIILVFLVALAIGAALFAAILRIAEAKAIAAIALVIAAAANVGGLWLFVYLTDGLSYFGMRSGLLEYLLRITTLAAVTIGPCAIASGMVLPALWTSWDEPTSVALPLGDLSAASLFGGVVGAVTIGFLAIPIIGVRGTLLVTAVIYLVFADLLAPAQSRFKPFVYAVLLAIVLANPVRAPVVYFFSKDATLQAILEGPSGIVTVTKENGNLQLRQDNFYVLGNSVRATDERRQGLIPILLHPKPRHVSFVGLATGITASAGPALGVEKTTVIELVPEVAAAAASHFANWNSKLLERPDVRLVLDDGRRYLAGSRDRFDVIVSDLFVPWNPGTGNLYAREMYQTAARRLESDGLFCQWLPLYQLTREQFDIIVRTFLSVFPHVSLWRDDFYAELPVVGLVGQFTPKPLDLTEIQERAVQLPDWAKDPLFSTRQGIAMLYVGDISAVPDLFAAAPINTDNRPLIEFLAPRLTRVNLTKKSDWFTGESLGIFYDNLQSRLANISDPLMPAATEVNAARRAGTALYHYTVAVGRHRDADAARYQAEVSRLVPEFVSAGADNAKTNLDTREQQSLVTLRQQQKILLQQLEQMQRRLDKLSGAEKDSGDRAH